MKPRISIFHCSLLTFQLILLSTVVSAQQVINSNTVNNTPDSRYTDHGNGTVTDKITGLMWSKCAEGQKWEGANCTGKATEYEWQPAIDHAKNVNYAGYRDWRVPTIKELNTLLFCSNGYQIKYKKDGYYSDDCSKGNGIYKKPTIKQKMFPNTPIAGFWSSSPDANLSSSAWIVSFDHGYDDGDDRSSDYRVRLVRSGGQ